MKRPDCSKIFIQAIAVEIRFQRKYSLTGHAVIKKNLHSRHEIISMVCDFPHKIIEKCFQ